MADGTVFKGGVTPAGVDEARHRRHLPHVVTSSALVNALCHEEAELIADSIPEGGDVVAYLADSAYFAPSYAGALAPWITADDATAPRLLTAAEAVRRYRDIVAAGNSAAASTDAADTRMRMWLPERGWLSAYLYGYPYYTRADITDNVSGAAAVVCGMLTEPVAEVQVARAPVYDIGMPLLYPSASVAADDDEDGSSDEATASGDGTVEARALTLRALAACRTGNEAAVDHAVASILYGGVTAPIRRPAMLTTVLCGFLGLRADSTGVTVRPFVPRWLGVDMSVSNLVIGDARYDITVRGTGDIISTFAIDNIAQHEYRIPASLSGSHTVTVTLAGHSDRRSEVNIVEPAVTPAPPAVTYSAATGALSVAPTDDPSVTNILYLNGVPVSDNYDRVFEIAAGACPVQVSVARHDAATGLTGFMSEPLLIVPSDAGTVYAAADIAEPGARILSDKEVIRRRRRVITRYVPSEYERDVVSSTRYHNDTLTFRCDVTVPGYYLVDVEYLDGLGVVNPSRVRPSYRRLCVDGADAGVLTFRQLTPHSGEIDRDWRTMTGRCAPLTVWLDAGVRELSLHYLPLRDKDNDNLLLVKALRLTPCGPAAPW